MDNPVAVITPTKTSTIKFIKAFGFVVLVIFILGLIWYFILYKNVDDKKVKLLINEEAKKYPTEKVIEVEKLLLQGVREIEYSPILFRQAKDYAKNNGIPLEQVLVANSIAMAKKLGYIGDAQN